MFKNRWRKADGAQKSKQELPFPKQEYLNKAQHRTYSCIHCRAHLADHDEIVSKLFQGNHGKAYLFNKVVNVGCKEAVERQLLTGPHAVADIYCDNCETTLGWKYEQAFVEDQKYKEGKYIIELVHIIKENNWDLNSHNVKEILNQNYKRNKEDMTLTLVSQNRTEQLGSEKSIFGKSSLSKSLSTPINSMVSLATDNGSQLPIPSTSIFSSPTGEDDSKRKFNNTSDQNFKVPLDKKSETRIEIVQSRSIISE